MGSLPDPSLLEYARFYGIAIDFTADDPLTHIETLQVSTPKLQPSSIERLEKAQQTITQAIHKEKLDVKIESARLLSTVIRDAKSEDINWAGVLPPFDRTEGFPVESPIFPAEYDTGIIAARKPLRYEETDIQLPPLEEPSSLIAALPTSLTHDMNKTMHDIKFEKLSCSKDAFMRIQRAKDCSGASRKDLEDVLMNELKSCQVGSSRGLLNKDTNFNSAYRASPFPANCPLLSSVVSMIRTLKTLRRFPACSFHVVIFQVSFPDVTHYTTRVHTVWC